MNLLRFKKTITALIGSTALIVGYLISGYTVNVTIEKNIIVQKDSIQVQADTTYTEIDSLFWESESEGK